MCTCSCSRLLCYCSIHVGVYMYVIYKPWSRGVYRKYTPWDRGQRKFAVNIPRAENFRKLPMTEVEGCIFSVYTSWPWFSDILYSARADHELQKESGEEYTPRSLSLFIAGLQHYISAEDVLVRLANPDNPVFIPLHKAIDNWYRCCPSSLLFCCCYCAML